MAAGYPEDFDSEADWESETSTEFDSISETESNGGKQYQKFYIFCLSSTLLLYLQEVVLFLPFFLRSWFRQCKEKLSLAAKKH